MSAADPVEMYRYEAASEAQPGWLTYIVGTPDAEGEEPGAWLSMTAEAQLERRLRAEAAVEELMASRHTYSAAGVANRVLAAIGAVHA